MRSSLILLMSCFLAASFVFTQVSAKCQTCSLNGIACINENSFQMCYKGQRHSSQIFSCPKGQVCVADSAEKCLPNTIADCGAEHKVCAKCDGSKLFTCLTPTTFAQCNGTTILRHISGSCPSGLLCDSTSPEICVINGAECS